MGQRRNQATLSQAEWTDLINAINYIQSIAVPPPRYRDFVRVHVAAMTTAVGMSWSVHTDRRMGMVGLNFLAWHRYYLWQFEQRLQAVNPNVTVPYWDWISQPNLPLPLSTPARLRAWGVTRQWNPAGLPTSQHLAAVNARTTFPAFQQDLESIHGWVHNAVGGTMMSSSSPADPLFWLHHANVDRIWAAWQRSHAGVNPPNTNDVLQPSRGFPVRFGIRVSTVLDIAAMNYQYV